MTAQIITDDRPQTGEKLGLALSGGGFRASFFHIGVLAQLARQGLLHQVEVISTVSGGSIIGALYYLHVKKLLESKPDAEITDRDYVRLVQDIERDFLKATENNIRMLTFADFKANWNMRRVDYSRSDRISELYNDLIYQPVLKGVSASPVSDPIQLRELKIFPPGQPDFHPREGNEARRAKVPILVINATALNSGRNWRFTAKTMGEPDVPDFPNAIRVDTKPIRLQRPPSYDGMVRRQQDFELGHSVGASAGVPGLFPPLSVSDLYRDGDEDVRVQLVDGGVHDNQGIGGLLDEGCTCFVVSDASGQMGVEAEPATGTLPVLLRTNGILQDRLRSGMLNRLFEAHGVNRVAFMNLRQGLAIRKLPWLGPDGQPGAGEITVEATTSEFGVAPQVQDLLSKVRTDLDAFTEVEAYSLMLDGYLMSDASLRAFREHAPHPGIAAAAPVDLDDTFWSFLRIAPWLKDPQPDSDYLKQLKVAGQTFGKALFLIPWLLVATVALAVLLLVVLGPWIGFLLQIPIPVYLIVLAVLVVVADKLIPKLAKPFKAFKLVLAPWEAIKRFFAGAALPVAGTLFIRFYLKFINPLFLKRGRVDGLRRRDPAKAG